MNLSGMGSKTPAREYVAFSSPYAVTTIQNVNIEEVVCFLWGDRVIMEVDNIPSPLAGPLLCLF